MVVWPLVLELRELPSNGFIMSLEWWKVKVELHPLYNEWAYQRFHYVTALYRKIELLTLVDIFMFNTVSRNIKMVVMFFVAYDFIEWILVNNQINKIVISLIMLWVLIIVQLYDRHKPAM